MVKDDKVSRLELVGIEELLDLGADIGKVLKLVHDYHKEREEKLRDDIISLEMELKNVTELLLADVDHQSRTERKKKKPPKEKEKKSAPKKSYPSSQKKGVPRSEQRRSTLPHGVVNDEIIDFLISNDGDFSAEDVSIAIAAKHDNLWKDEAKKTTARNGRGQFYAQCAQILYKLNKNDPKQFPRRYATKDEMPKGSTGRRPYLYSHKATGKFMTGKNLPPEANPPKPGPVIPPPKHYGEKYMGYQPTYLMSEGHQIIGRIDSKLANAGKRNNIWVEISQKELKTYGMDTFTLSHSKPALSDIVGWDCVGTVLTNATVKLHFKRRRIIG